MPIATVSATIETVAGGFAISLDGSPLATPAGNELVLPTRALARAMLGELLTQDRVDPSHVDLYCLASTAIDFTEKGKGIPTEGLARILLFDPCLQKLPETLVDVLEPSREVLAEFLAANGLVHPALPSLDEAAMENWIAESSTDHKRNLEGILRVARDLFVRLGAPAHSVVINAARAHKSFLLGLLLAQGAFSPVEYAMAVMAALRVDPVAWEGGIGYDQYRAAFEEVRLQADSMLHYLRTQKQD